MRRKFVTALVLLAALGGAAAYGVLVQQLDAFDRTVLARSQSVSGPISWSVETEPRFLARDIRLHVKSVPGAEPAELGGSVLLLPPQLSEFTLRGVFTPGLRPRVEFTSIESDAFGPEERAIAKNARPRLRVALERDFTLDTVEFAWDRVEVEGEVLGAGRFTADFEGRLGAGGALLARGEVAASAAGREEADRIRIGAKRFALEVSPAKAHFKLDYESEADDLRALAPPLSTGAVKLKLESNAIEAAHDSDARGETTPTLARRFDWEASIKRVHVADLGIPPVDVRTCGRAEGPGVATLPCRFLELWTGGDVTVDGSVFAPVCRSFESREPRELSEVRSEAPWSGLSGRVDVFELVWKGGRLEASGDFTSEPAFSVDATLKAKLAPVREGEGVLGIDPLGDELRDLFETLKTAGAVRTADPDSYETRIRATIDDEGRMRLTADGVNIDAIASVETPAVFTDLEDADFIVEAQGLTGEFLTGAVKERFGALWEARASEIPGFERMTSECTGSEYCVWRIALKAGTDMEAVDATVDALLTRIVDELPEGIEITTYR